MSVQSAPSFKLQYDGPLVISVGASRKETRWKSKELLWSDLLEKLSHTTRTNETYAQYLAMTKDEQGERKDVGAFIGGTLQGGRRKTGAVSWRQLITLDADFARGDLWESFTLLWDFAAAVYSTHKHAPGSPRLRLVLPLARPVSPEEYQAIARRIAADVGIDQFDDTTYQPHRLMYWPSTSSDGEYVFQWQDGPWLDPDAVLARYGDWHDPAEWPESSRTKERRHKLAERQGDPLAKPGLVGQFCRAYSIEEALETFLPEVYLPCADLPGRYTFAKGSTVGGLVLYDNGRFAYSHHATDPISGLLVNAFDLVRIHKFGDQDEDATPGADTLKMPSYKAMLAFAEADPKTQQLAFQERQTAMETDFKSEEFNPHAAFFDNKTFIPAFMGEWFMKRHKGIVINDELYLYEDGVYVPGTRTYQEEGTAALGEAFITRRLNEGLSYIKNTLPSISPETAMSTRGLLNVRNGLIDLATMELRQHTPELHTVIQLPTVYDPAADTSAIDEFLHLVMPADCVPVMEEMAGYCLTPSMQYEKALMLVGDGGNGKGTLIAVLTAMLGQQNVATVSFQDLSENRFASAQLYGKMANLHADIPNKILENSARFKELVSGDLIQAEEKHRPQFKFHNRAKLIFSANEPPTSRDNTEGFHRRMLIIPFPKKFTDRALRARLFTQEALSGFLLRALQGLQRLQRNGDFTKSATVECALAAYREQSDTVFRFLAECCEFEEKALTGKQELYDAYRLMCAEWGNQAVNQANFNRRLLILRPEITEYKKSSPRRWRGIKVLAEDFISN
jgi:P4 family phage/plasmid primase-like protien